MAYKDCVDAIKKAAGRDLTDDEAQAIFEAVEERIRREMKQGLTRAEAGRKAGRELSEETRLAVMIEKRSQTINALVWSELQGRQVEGREADAIQALVTGFAGKWRRPGNFANAGLSVDAMGIAAVERAHGAVIADLERAGLFSAVKRRDAAFERDIIREMWRMDDPNAGVATGNKHAADAAAILHKHMEIARLEQNKAGAWIGKQDHYVVRQTHDRYKVRAAGFDVWRETIEPRLDPRTFDGLESPGERTSWLRSVWAALSDGRHESATGDWQTAFKGPGNLAKKVSQSRKLHFASADGWMEYNAQFGQGDVFSAIMYGVGQGQRNAAVMRVLGTNPQNMLDRLVQDWADKAHARGDFAQVERLMSEAGKNSRILDRAMHKSIAPGNMTWANRWQLLRYAEMFKLGGSLLSSFNDLGTQAANARHNGIGIFQSMSDSVANLLPTDSVARREAAHEMGVGLDGLRDSIISNFMAADSPHGRAAAAVNVFMKWNGQNWWTSNMKEAHGMILANNLARRAGDQFSALPPLLQTTLRRYGIEDAEWNALRQGNLKPIDGNAYLFPASALDLPDAAVAGLGKTPDAARQQLHDKLSTYVIDNTREAMSEPTAGVRDLLTGGSLAPGTLWGEGARFVSQFKSFTATFMMRSLARELFRGGANVGGLATLIVASTALGYVAMTMKEIAKGRNPRTPETLSEGAKLVFAAMAQGGGFGLWGDFIFGEANRFGGGKLESALGPAAGTAGDVIRGFDAVKTALIEDGTRSGSAWRQAQSEALQMAKGMPPLAALNLFYTRAAMDYLVFWRLQEIINPGWARRYEQRVKRDNDQTFWLSPTAATR